MYALNLVRFYLFPVQMCPEQVEVAANGGAIETNVYIGHPHASTSCQVWHIPTHTHIQTRTHIDQYTTTSIIQRKEQGLLDDIRKDVN